jgi:branched-chain amino acid aminotransferase
VAIPVDRNPNPKPHVREEDLGFGKVFTDHMLRIEWDEGKGWHSDRIVPYGPIPLDPAACALHYGQLLFEGVKAYAYKDGIARLYRPLKHAERLNMSARKLCMPEIDPSRLVDGIKDLLRVDMGWLPKGAGTSMYVRPFMVATEPFLGVRPSKQYLLLVILSPVGTYFKAPDKPLRLWVEAKKARAAHGGIGASKAAANYVASLLAAEEAKHNGYDQVLWLDGARHENVEEVGTMNFMARIGDKVVTPALEGSILPGVTRDSVLQLLRKWSIPVEERKLPFAEIEEAAAKGQLKELFGTGTASVVAPVGELATAKGTIKVPDLGPQSYGLRLKEAILAIQRGDAPDEFGWLEKV